MKYNNRWKGTYRKADSKWEEKLRDGVLSKCEFHNHERDVAYIVPRTYQPDFVFTRKDKTLLYIEAKGRFTDKAEASKYIHIRNSLQTKAHELVFLFYDPNKPMPHAQKRKDGTKQTHAEWAEKNGFKWYTEETIVEILK